MGMRGVCRVTLLVRCEVLALAAWHGIPPPTHVPQRYPTHTRRQIHTQKSPADPVSHGTLPTAPAPTPRSCKRLRFFHGRTAARRQMGKWATVRIGIGMRCHPCVRHHRLLARALVRGSAPRRAMIRLDQRYPGAARSHAYVAALATCHRRWGERGQGGTGGSAGLFMTLLLGW